MLDDIASVNVNTSREGRIVRKNDRKNETELFPNEWKRRKLDSEIIENVVTFNFLFSFGSIDDTYISSVYKNVGYLRKVDSKHEKKNFIYTHTSV